MIRVPPPRPPVVLTERARRMYEDLERQVKDEAARQRMLKVIVKFDPDQSAAIAREAKQWEQQNGLSIGISSILAAFSKRES